MAVLKKFCLSLDNAGLGDESQVVMCSFRVVPPSGRHETNDFPGV